MLIQSAREIPVPSSAGLARASAQVGCVGMASNGHLSVLMF